MAAPTWLATSGSVHPIRFQSTVPPMAAPTLLAHPAQCRLFVSIHGAANGGPDAALVSAVAGQGNVFQSTVPPMAAPTGKSAMEMRPAGVFQSTVPPMAAPTAGSTLKGMTSLEAIVSIHGAANGGPDAVAQRCPHCGKTEFQSTVPPMAAPTRDTPLARELEEARVSIHGAANGGPDKLLKQATGDTAQFQSTVPPMAAPTSSPG